MKAAAVLAALFIVFLGQGHAQNARDAQSDPVMRIYTKLVQVPVIVTDKSGRPVQGLSKDDFALYEDGKKVTITLFQASSDQVLTLPDKKQAKDGVYSNVRSTLAPERPIIILVIDAINTPFLDQVQSRKQLLKLLSQSIEPGSLVSLMVISKSGLGIIHEYSTDTEVLIKALKRATIASSSVDGMPTAGSVSTPVSPESVSSTDKSLMEDFLVGGKEFQGLRRTAYSAVVLQSLREIAQRFAGVPGRKSLIWTASNFPYFGDDTTSINSGDIHGMYLQTFEELNDANIAIYPVDAAGLVGYSASGFETTRNPAGTRQSVGSGGGVISGYGDTALGRINEKSSPLDNMKLLAEITGGIPHYGTNDLGGAMRDAVTDSRDYYMLGYYLPGGAKAKLGRRQLKVEVLRKDLKLRSRTRLFVTRDSFSPRDDIMIALKSPVESASLPLTVTWDQKAPGPESFFVIAVDSPKIELSGPEASLNLTVVVEARTPQGKVLQNIDQTLAGNIKRPDEFRSRPFEYRNKLSHLAGPTTVRFIVRDNNSGRMGSVIVEVKE